MTISNQGDVTKYDIGGTVLSTAQGVVIMAPGQTSALGTTGNPLNISSSSASASASAGIYRRAAAVSATAGDGVIVTGVTTAGTVTLTLQNGGSLTVSVPLGSTILPLGVTAAALGTAVGGTFQSLFFV
jgi:hypothetical protein